MIDTSTIPGHGPDVRSLVKERIIATDPATAFADWASADALGRWWPAPGRTIELRIGGRFELLFDLDAPEGRRGSEGCRVLAYVPGEMLSFTWNAPPHLALRSANTWVVLTFRAVDDDTTGVRLVHTGFLGGEDWDAYLAYFDDAWDQVLDRQESHHAPAGRAD